MKQLSGLLQRMERALGAPLPDNAGFRTFTLSAECADAAALLAWLAAQALYPQFYWQHRREPEEAAACGAVCTFASVSEAEAFLQREDIDDDVRLWGVNAFGYPTLAQAEPLDGYLFLPRITLLRQGERVQLRVNIFSPISLRQDAEIALSALRQLSAARPLPPLSATVRLTAHHPEKAQWADLVQQALTEIEGGALEKVVLARMTRLTLDHPLPAATLMSASRTANHHCYHFMLAFTPESAFLGSSPERLYRREGKRLETEALAGTVANDRDDRRADELAQWLMQDVKNQNENQLVVDDIRQRLSQAATALDVLPMETIRLRKVQHLRRAIRAELYDAKDRACLQLLQPTAAVAGLPRAAARDYLACYEPFDRGWYAGSAGYLSRQQSEFCVSLRSADVERDRLTLYAGAGIVAGSDPQQEWQELENKAAGLKSLLDSDMS
ncbi:isochorismate synthase [Lonsdalea britannica]|uniref:isochorismate synthase MenF n=1 Tax=Lonsdalea britannica TaxID=1082704 RepID=UPI000A238328|nr:isochorismate synthase MenF [Lonsdalea britannica]OSM99799.1 isochorismate synthase [Lonsdalea britannica]